MRTKAALMLLVVAGCSDSILPNPAQTPAAKAPGLSALYEWTLGPTAPTPRTEVAAAGRGDRMLVAGGLDESGRALDVVEMLMDDAWQTIEPLPAPRHHAAMAIGVDTAWVLGGYDAEGAATDTVWSLDLSTDAVWVEREPMPTARGAHAAVLVRDSVLAERVHVVGGATGFTGNAELVAEHHVYDVDTGVWAQRLSLPAPRDHLAAALVADKVVVAGGRELSMATNTNRVDVYDPSQDAWEPGRPMSRARSGHAFASGIVFGGEEPEGTIAEVEMLRSFEAGWRRLDDMSVPRHGLGAGAVDGWDVYVVAGGPEPGLTVSAVTERLVSRNSP